MFIRRQVQTAKLANQGPQSEKQTSPLVMRLESLTLSLSLFLIPGQAGE